MESSVSLPRCKRFIDASNCILPPVSSCETRECTFLFTCQLISAAACSRSCLAVRNESKRITMDGRPCRCRLVARVLWPRFDCISSFFVSSKFLNGSATAQKWEKHVSNKPAISRAANKRLQRCYCYTSDKRLHTRSRNQNGPTNSNATNKRRFRHESQ